MSERETPYDIVFRRGRLDFEGERFALVRAEAEERGVPLDDPERFVMLGSVGALMRDMVLDEATADDAGEIWQALPPAAVAQMGALLFHAFRFHEAGAPVFRIDEATARALAATPAQVAPAAAAGAGDQAAAAVGAVRAPADTGYAQLPRNLFWARASDDGPAEPLDGFFWTLGRRFDVLLALGVRPRRPGFTVIPMGVDLGAPGGAASWADSRARTESDDFANILPGGEIGGLLGITSAAEALRLAALCLRWLAEQGDG